MENQPKQGDREELPREAQPGDHPHPIPPVDILNKKNLRGVPENPDEAQPFDPRRE